MKTDIFKEARRIELNVILNEFVELIKKQYPLFKDKVIAIPISLNAERFYDNKKSLYVRMNYTLLYGSPSNYTKVCWTTTNPSDLTDNETVNFIVDHDSCWRDGTNRTVNMFATSFEESVLQTFSENDLKKNKVHIDIRIGFLGIRFIDARLGDNKGNCIATGKSTFIFNK